MLLREVDKRIVLTTRVSRTFVDYRTAASVERSIEEVERNVAEVAHRVRAARSSVYPWQSLYETYGEDGLCPRARGRSDWKANDE